MDLTAARNILRNLAEGQDPLTGYPLSVTVLQQAAVVRALVTAIAVLEADAARARRRARLPQNVGRAWTSAEDQLLRAGFARGEAPPELARRHRRTLAGIESRLERLGLLRPEQRRTRNRYVPAAGPVRYPPGAGTAPEPDPGVPAGGAAGASTGETAMPARRASSSRPPAPTTCSAPTTTR